MQFRRLGNSGLKVSVVGLGGNNFGGRVDEAGSLRVLAEALDSGINLIDTADVYSGGESERCVGKALKGKREQAVIATKFAGKTGDGPNDSGGSRLYIRRAVERSLKRLDTDYIDLYQMHWPDPDTPVEESLETLNDLVHEGKVRYVGCSNYHGWQIAEAACVAARSQFVPFSSAQNQYSLLRREIEAEVIPACAHFGLGVLPYFPLAGGLLTGKYRPGEPPPGDSRLGRNPAAAQRWLTDKNYSVVTKLERFAQERGVSLLTIAIGWLAAKPQVSSVIAGATKPEQVRANVAAASWVPTPEDLAEIDRLSAIDDS